MSRSVFGKFATWLQAIWYGLTDIFDRVIWRLSHAELRETPEHQRITVIQFGDYAEGTRRFARGEGETYYVQRYTVDFMAQLVAREVTESLTIIALNSTAEIEALPNGICTSGIVLYPENQPARYAELIDIVKRTNPTHLIVISPVAPLIRWGVHRRIPVLPLVADSFRGGGLKIRLQNRLLSILLNHPAIELVVNHNIVASRDLVRIGVAADKVVPFDWPAVISPLDYSAKMAPPADRNFRLIHVGKLIESKCVGDVIRAVSELRNRDRIVELTLIGSGDRHRFEELVKSEKLEQQVTFAGVRKHSEVLAAMREHDAVLVPSH